MALSPSETRDLFRQACQFPTDHETVVEAVGDVAITSENGGNTDVETVLERSDATTYGSVAELHETVMANLTDEHIGRKYYDDRSSATVRETEVSF